MVGPHRLRRGDDMNENKSELAPLDNEDYKDREDMLGDMIDEDMENGDGEDSLILVEQNGMRYLGLGFLFDSDEIQLTKAFELASDNGIIWFA
jgi:hypothetical protein